MKKIDRRETQKKKKKKINKKHKKNKQKTEKNKGTEAIVKGRELNDFVVHLS